MFCKNSTRNPFLPGQIKLVYTTVSNDDGTNLPNFNYIGIAVLRILTSVVTVTETAAET